MHYDNDGILCDDDIETILQRAYHAICNGGGMVAAPGGDHGVYAEGDPFIIHAAAGVTFMAWPSSATLADLFDALTSETPQTDLYAYIDEDVARIAPLFGSFRGQLMPAGMAYPPAHVARALEWIDGNGGARRCWAAPNPLFPQCEQIAVVRAQGPHLKAVAAFATKL